MESAPHGRRLDAILNCLGMQAQLTANQTRVSSVSRYEYIFTSIPPQERQNDISWQRVARKLK